MKSEIQKQDRAQEAGRSSLHEVLERAEQPQIGDTYTRSDSRVTVKVVNVLNTYVAVEYTEDGKTDYAQHETELFRRLARKSIESGGRFEPARSKQAINRT